MTNAKLVLIDEETNEILIKFNKENLNEEEKVFLKKLMGLEQEYEDIEQVRQQLEKVKSTNDG